jgi:hypothetical protein
MAHMRGLDVKRIFLFSLVPALFRYLMPGYNPVHDEEPVEYTQWKREQLERAQAEQPAPTPQVVAS